MNNEEDIPPVNIIFTEKDIISEINYYARIFDEINPTSDQDSFNKHYEALGFIYSAGYRAENENNVSHAVNTLLKYTQKLDTWEFNFELHELAILYAYEVANNSSYIGVKKEIIEYLYQRISNPLFSDIKYFAGYFIMIENLIFNCNENDQNRLLEYEKMVYMKYFGFDPNYII
ncbi:MAG TPA: hypothetical protein PKK54_02335 [bacterium]|jgi:hypothetical protein|nr:hypothetical protein [bacterium]